MVGGRVGALTAIFDPGAFVAGGIVRHGVGRGVEVDAEGTYAYIAADGSPDINRNLVATRAGVKAGNDYVALTGGFGGGFAPAGGGFGAVDLGFILSYANCYVVPFVSSGVFASVPVVPTPSPSTTDSRRRPARATASGWRRASRSPSTTRGATRAARGRVSSSA